MDLCRVRLHEPLEVIVQNPLLYVRDLVPRPCFDALATLAQVWSLLFICYIRNSWTVWHNLLSPIKVLFFVYLTNYSLRYGFASNVFMKTSLDSVF